jgi:polar amino acid transport system substrate-binding protein
MIKRWVAGTAALLLLAGCGVSIPADPDGTLERVSGGVLRVGVSPNEPWTDVSGTEPSGTEVELITEFAESLDAEVEWRTGGEESLMADLEQGALDVVVGGLTAASPWAEKAALTTPYTFVVDLEGTQEAHVVAAPLGENAFLVTLERFLLEEGRQ